MDIRRKGIVGCLTSVRLGVALLGLIALGALLGTIIPQREAAGQLAARLSPFMRSLFGSLDLFDVYRSAWFVTLLVLLAVNLIACSVVRFPGSWRQMRAGVSPVASDRFADAPPDYRADLGMRPAEGADELARVLRGRFGPVKRERDGDRFLMAAESGAFSRLGVYGVHLGILLLIAGGLVGGVWGLKGYVRIPEGETTDILYPSGDKTPRPLGFQVRCDRFVVEYHENGAPKVFRSELAFLADGRVVREGAVMVNHPLDFGGLRFYQASYGRVPGGRLTLSWSREGEKGQGREIRTGDRFHLPGAAGEVEVLRIEDDMMRMGPAVKLSVAGGGQAVQFWVFERIGRIVRDHPDLLAQAPAMNPGRYAPWRFAVEKTGELHYTVLQVARDPGIPLVGLGAAVMIGGLVVVYFFSHRRIWAEVAARGEGSRVLIAGHAHRDPAGLDREIRRLLETLRAAEGPR